MVDSAIKMGAVQQAPPPAQQGASADPNAQATRNTSAPGDVSRTQSVSALGEGAQGVTGNQPAPSADELNAALADLRNSLNRFSRSLEFTVDEASDRRVVKVLDTQTDEVIRQIPSEEILALAAQLKEMSEANMDVVGAFMQETA